MSLYSACVCVCLLSCVVSGFVAFGCAVFDCCLVHCWFVYLLCCLSLWLSCLIWNSVWVWPAVFELALHGTIVVRPACSQIDLTQVSTTQNYAGSLQKPPMCQGCIAPFCEGIPEQKGKEGYGETLIRMQPRTCQRLHCLETKADCRCCLRIAFPWGLGMRRPW